MSTVRDKTVWLPSGERVPLPDGQFGTVAEYGSGFAWLTQAGAKARLNVAQRAITLDAKLHEVVGVEPGPDGSAMVRTKDGPVIVTADALQVTPIQPDLKTDHMVASANAIWVDDGRRVRRLDTSDLTHQPFAGRDLGPWRTVVVGDPRSDRVVVTDAQGCHAVLNGSTGATVWQSCGAASAFSADGQLAVARTVKYGSYGIIDLTAGELYLAIDQSPTRSTREWSSTTRADSTCGSGATRWDTGSWSWRCPVSAGWPHPTTRPRSSSWRRTADSSGTGAARDMRTPLDGWAVDNPFMAARLWEPR